MIVRSLFRNFVNWFARVRSALNIMWIWLPSRKKKKEEKKGRKLSEDVRLFASVSSRKHAARYSCRPNARVGKDTETPIKVAKSLLASSKTVRR